MSASHVSLPLQNPIFLFDLPVEADEWGSREASVLEILPELLSVLPMEMNL